MPKIFSRKQMGEFAMQLRSKHAAEGNQALQEALPKMKGQKGSISPTPKDLVKLGKFESTYLFYQVYSRDAHPTPHSLSRYLSRIVEYGEVIRCLDALPLAREGDGFTIQHACQAVLSAMFAANDIWTAGEAVRLTELGVLAAGIG